MSRTVALRMFPTLFLREMPRIVLIVLFAFAAIDKVTHFRGFITAVESYELLPAKINYSAAIFFVFAEFAIAIGLLTKRWRRPAALAAVLLLTTFTTVYLIARPAGVCGCWFTLTLSSGGYFHILQNLIFIALAVLTWFDSRVASLSPNPYSLSSERHSTAKQSSDDGSLKHVQT
jgi:uncharacterized membrane protein YphA (DoxX/SURF4 family)